MTFLGILELIRLGRIRIEQEHMFDDIRYLSGFRHNNHGGGRILMDIKLVEARIEAILFTMGEAVELDRLV